MSNLEDEFLKLLEKLIDARYKYLKEKDYENYTYASKIKAENYLPVVEEFREFFKKQLYLEEDKD